MGVFSSSRTVHVSSVVYNLAGDEDERPDYLKTLVLSNVISRNDVSMGQTINQGYLYGPGIKLRSFGRWARTSGYNDVMHLEEAKLTGTPDISSADVIPHIPRNNNQEVIVESIDVSRADYTYWVDRFIIQNYPDRVDEEYVADYIQSTKTVNLTFPDNTTDSFVLSNFDIKRDYLYVSYKLIERDEEGPWVIGEETSAPNNQFPDMSDWTLISTDETVESFTVETTTTTEVSYSDERPDDPIEEEVTASNVDFTESTLTYEKSEYQGESETEDKITSITTRQMHITRGAVVNGEPDVTVTTEEIEEGGETITVTTTVTVVEQAVEPSRFIQEDTQENLVSSWSEIKLLIYGKGMGNTDLDSLFAPEQSIGSFFTFIPVRHNSTFLSDSYYPDEYDWGKRALRKAIQGKLTDVIGSLEDNEDIGDIDFAFIVFGVSLNVKEEACSEYIYKFFQLMLANGKQGESAASFQARWDEAMEHRQEWLNWSRDQSSPDATYYGAPEPVKGRLPEIRYERINVRSGTHWAYDMTIEWQGLQEFTGTGKAKPDAKAGDFWFEIGETAVYEETLFNRKKEFARRFSADLVTLYWQEDENRWRAIVTTGLQHRNLVYSGKSVLITAKGAIEDDEESGFIIPLHEGIYRELSLKTATQMSTACTFLVLNSYQVVRQKWYQSGFFKVFIVVAAIAITVYTGGTGAGLLGTAASVGASLGFAGITATIVGSIANALAAIILAEILERGASMLFGDKLGSMIAAIATVVAVTVGSAYMDGNSLSSSFGSLTRAENLLKLTDAAGKGYTNYMQASTMELQQETQEMLAEYERVTDEITERYNETFGTDGGVIDPSMITDSLSMSDYTESSQSFLDRTLLAGSEIAELSIRMVDNFVAMTTSTELK